MIFEIKINEKLSLKLRQTNDAEEIFVLTDKNRKYLRPWLPWVDKTLTPEDTKHYIEGEIENFKNKTGADFGIWYEGKWVGSMGYHSINISDKKAAIGYWLGEEFTGKGIMTECVKAIIKYGFEELGLNRIEIECSTLNEKSRAIPERLGFTMEGKLRQGHIVNGVATDDYMFSLLKGEWSS